MQLLNADLMRRDYINRFVLSRLPKKMNFFPIYLV